MVEPAGYDEALKRLRQRVRGISLGLFAADLGQLRAAAEQVAAWGGDIVHFDIMDGVFVPQMTGGPGFVRAIGMPSSGEGAGAQGPLRDCHLMIRDPLSHVASYVNAGADIITVHAESENAGRALDAIRDAARKAARPVLAGLSLMPGTSLQQAEPLLALNPDLILVLSLDPRDGAAPDIPAACARLEELRARRKDAEQLLAFDGGVTLDSMPRIAACKPDMVVSGSAVFKADDPSAAYAEMAGMLSDG